MTRDDRRRGPVVESRRIALAAFRLGAVFAVVSFGWSLWVTTQGGSWWGPLHAFLAGTVLLAISGATQVFTITAAAASAPRAATVTSQRWLVAVGVGLALVGMTAKNQWATAIGAGLVVAGLAALAAALVSAVRRSLLRRFDLSSRFYLLAVAAGIVAVTLGGLMGSGMAGAWYGRMRLVHSHLNLVGLVGFTIAGTVPTILPTFAHQRAATGLEARIGLRLALVSVAAMLAGLVVGPVAVGLGTVIGAAALLAVLAGVMSRLGRRSLGGGLPYLQVTVGCGWLSAWALVDGGRLVTGATPEAFGVWTRAAIIAGVGQVLLGSLAYLLPVLAGPNARFDRNIRRTLSRPWLPLALANLAGLAFVTGLARVAIVAACLWVLDFVYRLARIEWRHK